MPPCFLSKRSLSGPITNIEDKTVIQSNVIQFPVMIEGQSGCFVLSNGTQRATWICAGQSCPRSLVFQMGLRETPLLEMDLFLSIFQIEDVGFVNLVFEKFCCNEFPKPYSKLGQLEFDVHGTLSC